MRPLHWLVQTDLGDRSGISELLATLAAEGVPFSPIARHPPFSTAPPVFTFPDDTLVLVYGTTSLVATVAAHQPWAPGVFFEPAQFSYSAWAQHYGEHLLNSPSEVIQTTLGAVATLQGLPGDDEPIFVRPEHDLKEFNGGIQTVGQFRAFAADVARGGYPLMNGQTAIVIGAPHGIDAEWRVFVSDQGEVLAASRYRWKGRKSWVRDTPEEVLAFARARAKEWSPAPVFVMDVARSGEGLFIVEAQCAHSAGLYDVDLVAWVHGMNRVVQRWAETTAPTARPGSATALRPSLR